MMDKVGVVITTYKRPKEVLFRAIKSVMSQTYTNFDLVVVDDSPSDYTERGNIESMINELNDSRIMYIKNANNVGSCASRNIGADFCNGNYIAFLDDDDEWFPKKLEKQINEFKDENVDIVYSNAEILYEETGKKKVRDCKTHPQSGNIYDALFCKNIIGSTSFPMIRKKSYDRVGGFDEKMPALQDWDLWLRIAKTGGVKYIPDVLCRYHFYEGERLSANSANRVVGYNRIREKHIDYLNSNRDVRAKFNLVGSFFYSNDRDIKRALIFVWKAVKDNPFDIKNNIISMVKAIGRFFIKAKIR